MDDSIEARNAGFVFQTEVITHRFEIGYLDEIMLNLDRIFAPQRDYLSQFLC